MKRRIRLLPVALAALLCLSACAARSEPHATYAASTSQMAAAMPAAEEFAAENGEYLAFDDAAATAESAAVPADAGVRKIVYNADLSVTADDPEKALSDVSARAAALGGYVADSSLTTDDDGVYLCTAVLKVPAGSLDALVTAAKALGEVNDYSLSSSDISQQYYDISARLGSAKAEEAQLLEMLKLCATVEDMLRVREQLAAVRADIESYQGQINLWDNLVSYATLSVSVRRTPKAPVAEEKSLVEIWRASDVWKQVTRGFQNSARITVNVVSAVLIFLACALIPGGVLFLCIGLPILLHRKKKKRLRAAKAAETAAATTPPAQEQGQGQKQGQA